MRYIRDNQSSSVYFPPDGVPFAEGSFKLAYLGVYTDGPRRGERCVSKVPIPRSVFGRADFGDDMNIIRLTEIIIDAWNVKRLSPWPIVLSKPEIWIFHPTGEECLVEPYIRNFRKFNTNSGRVYFGGTSWSDVLQALSHFSYDHTFGRAVLCDIQGGIYPDRL